MFRDLRSYNRSVGFIFFCIFNVFGCVSIERQIVDGPAGPFFAAMHQYYVKSNKKAYIPFNTINNA